METYQEAKKWMTIRILGISLIIGMVLMCLMLAIGASFVADGLAKLAIP